MSAQEHDRTTRATDAHLADRAAYGDHTAFTALAGRYRDQLWTAAVLTAADSGVAVRATARALTRTLAERAAGIRALDDPLAPSLVAAVHELAGGDAPRSDERQPVDLPAPLAALDAPTRVALWLVEAQGWHPADAEAAVSSEASGPGLAARLSTLPPTARAAARTFAVATPAALPFATATAWREWQGISLTVPDRHPLAAPLAAALAGLDEPLGRLGDALGRAGDRVAARATPARKRLLAALTVGVLTAAAVGSLLVTDTTSDPRRDDAPIAAGAPDPARPGDLLDDRSPLGPAADVPGVGSATAAPPDAGADPDRRPVAARQPHSAHEGCPWAAAARPGLARSGAGPLSSGGTHGSGPPTGATTGSPAAGSGSPTGSSGGDSSGGSSSGGSGGGDGPARTEPAPPVTTAPPTTEPPPAVPPPTAPPVPPPPPPPPPLLPPTPLCGLLPLLCP